MYVIIGNSALIKCEIPSFVSDFVNVVSWVDNEGNSILPSGIPSKIQFLYGAHKHIFAGSP